MNKTLTLYGIVLCGVSFLNSMQTREVPELRALAAAKFAESFICSGLLDADSAKMITAILPDEKIKALLARSITKPIKPLRTIQRDSKIGFPELSFRLFDKDTCTLIQEFIFEEPADDIAFSDNGDHVVITLNSKIKIFKINEPISEKLEAQLAMCAAKDPIAPCSKRQMIVEGIMQNLVSLMQASLNYH